MYCPNCGNAYLQNAEFCIRCGVRRNFGPVMPPVLICPTPAQPVMPPVISAPVPQPAEQGTHWIPLLIMTVLAAAGLFLYLATSEQIPITTGDPVTLSLILPSF